MIDTTKKEQPISDSEIPKAPGNIGDENTQSVSVESANNNNVSTETVLPPKEEPKTDKPINTSMSPEQEANKVEAEEAKKIAHIQNAAAKEVADKIDKAFEQDLKKVNKSPETQVKTEIKQEIPSVEPQAQEILAKEKPEIQAPVQPQVETPSIESINPSEQPSLTAEATPPPLPSEKISEEDNQKKQADVELTSITSQTNIKSESPIIDEKKEEKMVESTEGTKRWWEFWKTKSQENPNPQTEEAAKKKNKEELEKIAGEHPENKQQNN